MLKRARLFSALFLALSGMPLLQGCAEIDQNVKKAVWMKYTHVANVRMFQTQSGVSQTQFVGTGTNSFWAVFDLCTLDVQGSSLSGFSYNANNFFIDAGSASYGSSTPGNVNAGGSALSSQDPQVINAVRQAFSLSPTPQFFPKQFYPNLRYRIAIFVRENPSGYQGGSMTLKYSGQPQVAALVENVSPGSPSFRDFYNPFASAPIASTCP